MVGGRGRRAGVNVSNSKLPGGAILIDRRRRDVSNVVVSCMKELGTLSQHLAAAAVVITLARSDLGHSPCVWLEAFGSTSVAVDS